MMGAMACAMRSVVVVMGFPWLGGTWFRLA
jgi:hypothetical protein